MAEPRRRGHPLYQLTLLRLRGMTREPGVLFWIFGFPILISLGLDLAFRVGAPDPPGGGVLPGTPPELGQALARGGVEVRQVDEAAARLALRSGKIALVLVPSPEPG